MLQFFVAQVLVYAIVPFCLVLLPKSLRGGAFYVYIGILLLLTSFMGSVYSLPLTPTLSISGGNLAYGALLMSTVLLVIIERDVAAVRHVIGLVAGISVFTLLLFALFVLILNEPAAITPYRVDAGAFLLALPITVLGGALTIFELVLLLFAFEEIKRRVTNVTVVSCLYTICFVVALCLDGLLYPQFAFVFEPHLVPVVIGGVMSKLLLGLAYSIPVLLFLMVYRRTLTDFVEKPLTLTEMLKAPKALLVEEIQRQRASLALGEEQIHLYAQRLALAAESVGLGIWDLDVATNALVWDARSYEMYGVVPAQTSAQTSAQTFTEMPAEIRVTFDTWKARIHPDDLAKTMAAYEDALAGRSDYHVEFRVVRPDGDIRYVEAHAIVQRNASGAPHRMIGVNWDITQRRLLAQENAQLTEQFYQAQRLESIGRLAGGIAHDFNNLLVPISSYAELGQRKTSSGDSTHTYFGRIKEAADRAAGLTRQILAFSRKQSLEMKLTDLNQIVTEFQIMLQRFLGESITLELALSRDALRVMADAGQLEQVLMNLVVNARDAMPNGGTFTISTGKQYLEDEYVASHHGERAGVYVLLAVADTGLGMDETVKQRVFEPFFTTKPQGQGTGLGLATVFGIVKQHHGMIDLASEVGKGTTFQIFLPCADE